ncbi:hypothetical protein V8B97DRAFT_2056143 [Scleroderma yunnanense]
MDIQSLTTIVRSLQAPLIGSFISLIGEKTKCLYQIAVICYLIAGFGDLLTLQIIAWDFVLTTVEVDLDIGFVLILVVNSFFIWRVWVRKSGSSALCISPVMFNSYECSTVHSFNITSTPLAISMGVATLGDTLITLTLAYYLHSKRTQRCYSSAQLITRLLAYVVVTGALTRFFTIFFTSIVRLTSKPSIFSILKLISVKSSICASIRGGMMWYFPLVFPISRPVTIDQP